MAEMKKKQLDFLQSLMTEKTTVEAAKKAGISRSTAYKYLEEPEFKQALAKAKAESLSNVIRYLQGKLTVCSEELVKIIEKPETADQVRINAINAVFNNVRALTETCEIEDRMQEIEKLLQERGAK